MELEELLQSENSLWTEIYLPLTWQVFKNVDNLHVIVKIDIIYDDQTGQRPKVLAETIHNTAELEAKVAAYLRWARTN